MLMAHQPDDLTVEAIKAAAKEFALRINREGFHESVYFTSASQAIVRVFHRSVADQFHLPMTAPHASEDELPTINVMVLATQGHLPVAIPYQNAYQAVYGVGQPVLIFRFRGDSSLRNAVRTVTHVLFFQPEETGDCEFAEQIHEILNGTEELDTKRTELIGLFVSLRPKLTRVERVDLASEVLQRPPAVGGLRYGSLRWRVWIPAAQMERFDLLSTAEPASGASAPQESAAHDTTHDNDQHDAAPSE
jgi:hypothetical protein